MATGMISDSDKVGSAIRFIKELGLPIVMVCVMGWVIYQGAIWIGETILQPTLTANQELVAEQVKSGQELRTALQQMAKSVEATTIDNRKNSEAIVSMASSLKQIEFNTGKTANEVSDFTDIAKKSQEKSQELLLEHNKVLDELKKKNGGSE